MKTKIVLVTPELTEEFLKKNKNNRPLNLHVAQSYADDMKNGKWLDNGEPLAFDKEGYLRNGQHRCKAVTICKIPREMLIVYDLPEEDCRIFDRGKPRSTLDTLRMGNSVDPYLCNQQTIAAIRLLVYEDTGINKISDFEVIEYINKNEETLKLARKLVCGKRKNGINLSAGVFIAIFFTAITNKIPISVLQEFAEILNSGIPNETWQTAPIILRNDFLTQRLPITLGGSSDRIRCMYASQKAILDFENKYKRKKSYKNDVDKIFSSFGKED